MPFNSPVPDWLAVGLGYVVLLVAQLIALAVIPARRRPAVAHAWLLLIFLQPILGWALYLLIANRKLAPARRAAQREMEHRAVMAFDPAHAAEALQPLLQPVIPERYRPLVRLGRNVGGLSAFGGNQADFLADYDGAIRQIAADIDDAQGYVHVEYFALALDAATEVFFQALERASGRGVRVRVLFDHFGSLVYRGYGAMRQRLRAANIEAQRLLPLDVFSGGFSRPDLRNHRKLVVVDGRLGYIGSQNMIDKTYYRTDGLYYDELVARVSGPVVAQLDATFAADWYAETREQLPVGVAAASEAAAAQGGMLAQVLPSGAGSEVESNLWLFVALLHQAQHRIMLVTPYFVPDVALLCAMTIAAQRGVDVTLLVSGAADQFLVSRAQWSYYEELLESGVKIWTYNPPVLLHSKTISIDHDIAVISTSNLDIRSFQLDLEVTLALYDTRAVDKLRAIEARYLERSSPVSLGAWRRRPFAQKFMENTARLFSTVL